MRIGIFGGSFNPPHKTHLQIANYLLDNGLVDKVIYVPAGVKYKYKNNLVSNMDRFNMLKLMIQGNDNLDVSDNEFTDEVTYTYQTLDYFRSLYPDAEIYFICGADNLDYIDKWENAEYILKNYPIIVFKRGDYKLKELYGARIIVSNMDLSEVSSTSIRNRLKNNDFSIEELPLEVLDYIKENGLYR